MDDFTKGILAGVFLSVIMGLILWGTFITGYQYAESNLIQQFTTQIKSIGE